MLGPDEKDEMQVQVPNRILSRICAEGKQCISCGAGPRHAEIIIRELKVHAAKSLSSRTVRPNTAEYETEKANELELAPEEATRVKSLVARANHLTADWADVQFACRKLSTKIAHPSIVDWQQLARLAR